MLNCVILVPNKHIHHAFSTFLPRMFAFLVPFRFWLSSPYPTELIAYKQRLLTEMDMERLATFFSDTAKFDWYDGKSYDGVDAFVERIMEDTLDNEWDFRWAYSLDANIEEPGDWVHAGFDVRATKNEEAVEHAWYQEWYYIEDGKVSYWYNMKAIRQDRSCWFRYEKRALPCSGPQFCGFWH